MFHVDTGKGTCSRGRVRVLEQASWRGLELRKTEHKEAGQGKRRWVGRHPSYRFLLFHLPPPPPHTFPIWGEAGDVTAWPHCPLSSGLRELQTKERLSYEPNPTVSRAWGRKHAHCCDLGHDDVGRPSVSSRAVACWDRGGHPVPACDEPLPAEVQEQADLVGR